MLYVCVHALVFCVRVCVYVWFLYVFVCTSVHMSAFMYMYCVVCMSAHTCLCVGTFVCASMIMCVCVFVGICVSVQHFLCPLSQHKVADSWSPTQHPVLIPFDVMNFGAPAPNLGRIFISWTPSLVVVKFLLIRAGIRSLPKTFAG